MLRVCSVATFTSGAGGGGGGGFLQPATSPPTTIPTTATTVRTCTPASSPIRERYEACDETGNRCATVFARGRRTVKVVPPAGVESTLMAPSWASTIWRTM